MAKPVFRSPGLSLRAALPRAPHKPVFAHLVRKQALLLQIGKIRAHSGPADGVLQMCIRDREKKRVAAELYLHSDQGFQYTSQAYFTLTQAYGITPSMSRKGNPYDNAMAENFFSILKTECIYRHKPETFSEANEMIDRYIYFYNRERIQLKTGEAPLARRLST